MAKNTFSESPVDTFTRDLKSKSYELPDLSELKRQQPEQKPDAGLDVEYNPDDLRAPEQLKPLFSEAAKTFDVPSDILQALAQQESSYRPDAIGTQTKWGRAKGIMQYIDPTADTLGINPFDPAQAIGAAAGQFRARLDNGYSIEEAIMAHHGGDDRLQWGPKTRDYARKVMKKAGLIGNNANAYGGDEPPAMIAREGTGYDPSTREKETPEEMVDRTMRGTLPERDQGPVTVQEGWSVKKETADGETPKANLQFRRGKPEDMKPEDYDSFTEATGKELRNLPENFTESAGGLVELFGESMAEDRERGFANAARRMDLTPEEFKLVYWAESNDLISDEMKSGKDIKMTVELLKDQLGAIDDERVQKAVVDAGLVNPERLAGFGEHVRKSQEDQKEEVNAEPGSMAYYGSQAIRSIAENVPALAMSVATKNPAYALGDIGVRTAGRSYGEGRDKGLSPEKAREYATTMSLAEVIPSTVPVGRFMSLASTGGRVVPGGKFVTKLMGEAYNKLPKQARGFLGDTFTEGAQEAITATLQAGIDKDYIDPDMSLSDALKQIADGAIIGTIAGAGMSGSLRAGQKGVYEARGGEKGERGRTLAREIERGNQGEFSQQDIDRAGAEALDPRNAQMEQVSEEGAQRGTQEDVQQDGFGEDVMQGRSAEEFNEDAGRTQPLDGRVVEPETQAPGGPLERAKQDANREESLDAVKGSEVTVKTRTGIINGVVSSYTEDGQGNFDARILDKDTGELFQFTQDDGVDINMVMNPRLEEGPGEREPEEPQQLEDMTGAQLRERFKALTQQGRQSGWTPNLLKERQQVETMIDEINELEQQQDAQADEMLAQQDPEELREFPEAEEALATPPPEGDRRQDLQTRRKVAEMSEDEMRQALLQDDLTGLGNRRSYEENPRKPVQVSVDADSLKWVNDNMGHVQGDEMLIAIGRAFQEVGADAYHPSGDEFWVQADTQEEADRIMQEVSSRLADAIVEFETPDGEIITKRGIGLSYGTADTIQAAEEGLQAQKAAREASGERAGRGQTPPGVTRTRSDTGVPEGATEGDQGAQGDAARGQAEREVTPKQQKAIDRIEKGEAWFGSREKAQAFIDKNDLGDTYGVQPNGKRFDIKRAEDIVEPKPAPEGRQVKNDGSPFANEALARNAMKNRRLEGYEVVTVEGGYALDPIQEGQSEAEAEAAPEAAQEEAKGKQRRPAIDSSEGKMDLSKIPDSVLEAFVDLQETPEGLIPTANFTPDEKAALEEAGVIQDVNNKDGELYDGVNPEFLWQAREAAQKRMADERKAAREEREQAEPKRQLTPQQKKKKVQDQQRNRTRKALGAEESELVRFTKPDGTDKTYEVTDIDGTGVATLTNQDGSGTRMVSANEIIADKREGGKYELIDTQRKPANEEQTVQGRLNDRLERLETADSSAVADIEQEGGRDKEMSPSARRALKAAADSRRQTLNEQAEKPPKTSKPKRTGDRFEDSLAEFSERDPKTVMEDNAIFTARGYAQDARAEGIITKEDEGRYQDVLGLIASTIAANRESLGLDNRKADLQDVFYADDLISSGRIIVRGIDVVPGKRLKAIEDEIVQILQREIGARFRNEDGSIMSSEQPKGELYAKPENRAAEAFLEQKSKAQKESLQRKAQFVYRQSVTDSLAAFDRDDTGSGKSLHDTWLSYIDQFDDVAKKEAETLDITYSELQDQYVKDIQKALDESPGTKVKARDLIEFAGRLTGEVDSFLDVVAKTSSELAFKARAAINDRKKASDKGSSQGKAEEQARKALEKVRSEAADQGITEQQIEQAITNYKGNRWYPTAAEMWQDEAEAVRQLMDTPPPPAEDADQGQGEADPKQSKPDQETAEPAIEERSQSEEWGANNKLVTRERAEELRKKLRAKLGQMNSGMDPEILAAGTELAVYHLEAGARKFAQFARAIAADLGTKPSTLRPYLRSWYNGGRDMMEDHGLSIEGTDGPDEVRAALQNIEALDNEADTRGNQTDQGRPQESDGGPGTDTQRGSAQADNQQLEAGEPANVEAPADSGTGASVRGTAAAENVDSGTGEPGSGDAVSGREGESGTGASDAGTGSRQGAGRGGRGTKSSGGRSGGRGGRESAAGTESRKPQPESVAAPGPGNFHYDNPLEIVGGGQVARFKKNQQAIERFVDIRDSGRPITAEDQRIIAGYTGWGSFGQELFQGTWDRPRPKEGWEERDQWLRDNLGRKEWEGMQASIINAHYTDPPTVMAMWDMVRAMGFEGGRVLEPSMGIGNFFGMMPQELKSRSNLAGIELDPVTGGMAKILYPEANINVMGYEQSKTPDNFYDLVIGNWPFANIQVPDRRYQKLNPNLHDYFFLKALDQTRPGGLVVGITTHGSMDKKGKTIRNELARKGELVAAYRLPTGAFQEYAGTKVVTDIIVLRKRSEPLGVVPADAGWLNSVPYDTPSGNEVFVNEYFVNNPDNVIGTIDFGSGTTTGRPGLIVNRPDDVAEQLNALAKLVPADAFQPDQNARSITYTTNHLSDREGSLVRTEDGELGIVRGEYIAKAQDVAKYAVKSEKTTKDREAQLDKLIGLRRAYGQLVESEANGTEADATKARKELKKQYDSFVKAHKRLNDSYGLKYMARIEDPFYPALAALERQSDNGYIPADILTQSTMRGAKKIANPSTTEAYVLARSNSVNPTLKEVSERAGKPEEEVRKELVDKGAIFELPNGDIQAADIYLSGNVRQKLREARAALDAGNKAMERNVRELERVKPADIPSFNIETQMGATWVPKEYYAQFVADMLGLNSTTGIEATYRAGRWKIQMPYSYNKRPEATAGSGTEHYPFSKLVNAAISNQTVVIRHPKDPETGRKEIDTAKTQEVNGKIAQMRMKFSEWVWSDPERRTDLEYEYNETRNAYAVPSFDGSFMAMEGMALTLGNGPFDLRKHQQDAIWRAIVTRKSLNAHEVGTGKTFTMGGIAVESRRYGLAKKPMILAHNANSKTVANEIQQMYPAAKVLYIDNLNKNQIATRMRQIANDDWDAVVVPHSLINNLGFREETLMELAQQDIDELMEEAYEAAEEDGVSITDDMLGDPDEVGQELGKLRSPTAKELVKARNNIVANIKKQALKASKEGSMPFEELGIDMVLVDEVHEFKKPPLATKMRIKGMNTTSSNRSIALRFMLKYIRGQNNGGNVHTFSGTPITNSMTEAFHQMKYIMEEEMRDAGMDQWDGWFGSFAQEEMDIELNAAGEYEAVTRLSKFINTPELRRMIGQYMDVVFSDDMPEMQPRKTKSGKTLDDKTLTDAERKELTEGRTENAKDRPYKQVLNRTADLTEEQRGHFETIQGWAREFRNMTGRERMQVMREGDPRSPIVYEGLAARVSFDARLMNGEALAGMEGMIEDDPNSKASRALDNIMEVYESDPRATQAIFTQIGLGKTATRSVTDSAGNKTKRTYKSFSTIHDMVERLVQRGVPREQIAIVTGSTSKDKRAEIAEAMNRSEIRIVFGSTQSLGVGVNMQKNLRAMHHMDAPWMPGDLEQRNGRGQRQGNQWNTVREYRYLTDRIDGRRWQLLVKKQQFIEKFLKADDSVRIIDADGTMDEDSDLLESFSEAAGDSRILQRAKIEKKINMSKQRERLHSQGIAAAKRQARELATFIESRSDRIGRYEAANVEQRTESALKSNAGDGFTMTIEGKTYTERSDAKVALAEIRERIGQEGRQGNRKRQKIGQYGDIDLFGVFHPANGATIAMDYGNDVEIETGTLGLQSLEGTLRGVNDRIEKMRGEVQDAIESKARAEKLQDEPFAYADDLKRQEEQLAALEQDLQENPVAPPAWLRTGAPVETEVLWEGRPFTVTGHRWNSEGWFVLAENADGNQVAIPYMEVRDAQGFEMYEEREFVAPEVVEDSRPQLTKDSEYTIEQSKSGENEGRWGVLTPGRGLYKGQPENGFDTKRDAQLWVEEQIEAGGSDTETPNLRRAGREKYGSMTRRLVDRFTQPQNIMKGWDNAPELVTAEKFSDLPPALQKYIRDNGAQKDFTGVYWDGAMYLYLPNIPNANALQATILHEGIGHYGVMGFFGSQFEGAAQQIFQNFRGTPEAKKIIKDYFTDEKFTASKREHRVRVGAELLAHLAEKNTHNKLWTRVKGAIQNILRRMGFTINPNRNDLNAILRAAERFVKNGEIAVRGKNDAFFRRDGDAPEITDPMNMPLGKLIEGVPALADQVNQAYEDGDLALAEELDGRLAEAYDRIESAMFDIEEDGLGVPSNDATAAAEVPMLKALLKGQGDFTNSEPSIEEEVANSYQEFLDGRIDAEDLAEQVRGILQEHAHKQGGLKEGITDNQLGAMAQEVYQDRLRRQRQATRGNKSAEQPYLSRVPKADDMKPGDRRQAEKKVLADAIKALKQREPDPEVKSGKVVGDMSRVAKFLLHPRQVASLHKQFTPAYVTAINQFEMRDRIIDTLYGTYNPYMILPKDSKANVNKVLELGRIIGTNFEPKALKRGVEVPSTVDRVELDEFGSAYVVEEPIQLELSKAGDTIKLNDAEREAYLQLRQMFDDALEYFKSQMLREFGLDHYVGTEDVAEAIMEEVDANPEMPTQQLERLVQIAKTIEEIEQAKRRGYVPLSRHGDYVVTVKQMPEGMSVERQGDSTLVSGLSPTYHEVVEAIGGTVNEDGTATMTPRQYQDFRNDVERVVYSTKVETGLRDAFSIKKLGDKGGKVADIPAVKKAIKEINDKWVKGHPNREILTFAPSQIPQEGVNLSEMDNLASLAGVDNAQWEFIRGQMEDEIKGRSFRRHFFRSDNTPGYSVDFERNISQYIAGMGGYLARRHYAKQWDDVLSKMKAPRVYEYTKEYRDYINDPAEEYAMIRQIGFLSYIAGNLSTAVVNGTQVAVMTMPALQMISSHTTATREVAKAYKDAIKMFRLNRKTGLQVFDVDAAPADVRQELKEAWGEGAFVPLETYEVMATARARGVGQRQVRRKFEKGIQAIAYTFTAMERLNRLVTFIAAARIAKNPRWQARIRETYQGNPLAQAQLFNEGGTPSPKKVGEFMIYETQYRMGKVNRPRISRGIGAPIMQFKSFMMQSLEAWYRWMSIQGRQGKLSALASLAMMTNLGGLWGFPGGEEIKGLIEDLYRLFMEEDKDLETDLRLWIGETTGQQWLAEYATKGAGYPLGVDLSRIGLGELLPNTPTEMLGIPADLFIGRPTRAFKKSVQGDYVGATAEFMPNFIKNPMQAYSWGRDGIRDGQGRMILLPEQVTPGMIAKKSIGFQPSAVTSIRDYEYAQYRAETAIYQKKTRFLNDLARTIAQAEMTQDPEQRMELDNKIEQIFEDIERHNKGVEDESRLIQITDQALNNRIMRELEGVQATYGRERTGARSQAEKMREAFGINEILSPEEEGSDE